MRVERRSRDRVIPGRLILHRLAPELADQARDWVRREQGKHATAETIEMAEYVALFTTAPRSRLNTNRALSAYRLRWQIELQFKRCKSLCGFDRLPNERADTIESWIYAKMLLALVMDKLGAAATELSPTVRLVGPQRIDRRRRQESPPAERPLAKQPWKVTSILWPILVAAILPLRLEGAIDCLPTIAMRIDSYDTKATSRRVRQVQDFRDLCRARTRPGLRYSG